MANTPTTADRIESASDITMTVSVGGEGDPLPGNEGDSGYTNEEVDAQIMRVPISSLDRTKDIEVNEIRQSSVKANGYSITSISFSGSMMFKGERVHGPDDSPKRIEDILFDEEGIPNAVSITISHELSGKSETYQDVLVTSDSYEVQSGSETETAFDWVAMDKDTTYPDDTTPTVNE